MRIVYVEDDITNQSLVERVTSMGDHEVINYNSAEMALDNFEYDDPDMMVVDIMLAGNMNGLQLVRELRAAGYNRPIVAVTAFATQRECLDAGCDDFFVKPVAVGDFWDLIQYYASQYGE